MPVNCRPEKRMSEAGRAGVPLTVKSCLSRACSNTDSLGGGPLSAATYSSERSVWLYQNSRGLSSSSGRFETNHSDPPPPRAP